MTVVVRVMPNQRAVIVTVVGALTADVLTANAPLDAPPLTTTSGGTRSTAGLLLDEIDVRAVGGAGERHRPVAELPPVRLVGTVLTLASVGPAGVAALTDRFAVRGTFWIAAMICTISAGAAALVVIVNVALVAPAGTTTDAGTVGDRRGSR